MEIVCCFQTYGIQLYVQEVFLWKLDKTSRTFCSYLVLCWPWSGPMIILPGFQKVWRTPGSLKTKVGSCKVSDPVRSGICLEADLGPVFADFGSRSLNWSNRIVKVYYFAKVYWKKIIRNKNILKISTFLFQQKLMNFNGFFFVTDQELIFIPAVSDPDLAQGQHSDIR